MFERNNRRHSVTVRARSAQSPVAAIAHCSVVYRCKDFGAGHRDTRRDCRYPESAIAICLFLSSVRFVTLSENVERGIGIALADPIVVVACKSVLRLRGGKRAIAFHCKDHALGICGARRE